MIAFVVASTSHPRVRRLPGRDRCGTRVHTIPGALATSTAATRSTTCSYSSSSISCGSLTPATSSRHRDTRRDARGPRPGTEILTGVLEAQCATHQGQAPAPDSYTGSGTRLRSASAGSPSQIFTPARRPLQGYQDSYEVTPSRVRWSGGGRRIVVRPAGCGSRLAGQAVPGSWGALASRRAQVGIDLAGGVTLEAADDFLLRQAFFGAP